MKVCMLSYSYYEGDARIIQYASALAERGDEVDVICLKHPGDSPRDVLDSVNVFRIQERTKDERGLLTYLCRILRFLVVSAAVLTKRHLRRRYSVIHVHSVPDFLVFAPLATRFCFARWSLWNGYPSRSPITLSSPTTFGANASLRARARQESFPPSATTRRQNSFIRGHARGMALS